MGTESSFAIARAPKTMIPGEEACIISGLNWETCEIILGLRAKERGTF